MRWILGTSRKTANPFPPFRPHPLLRGGHAQTLAGNYLPGVLGRRAGETLHHVRLEDGDQIVLHDDRPNSWTGGEPCALLLHGLGGCHESGYLFRAARKLNARGIRSFRMDYRTCGAGRNLARRAYHAGQSEDVLAALRFIERAAPTSPISIIGYSMGGNVALKTLGEHPGALPRTIARAAVVNPAIDLLACCNFLTGPIQRAYDRHFAQSLIRHVSTCSEFAPLATELAASPIGRIRDFDERFTAPHWGFDSVEEYYRLASAAPHLGRITVPTLVIHSQDDPLIPATLFQSLDRSDAVTVHMTTHGGHLGFIGASGVDPDRRWMDWRLVDWVTRQTGPADVPQTSRASLWRRSIARPAGKMPAPTVATAES